MRLFHRLVTSGSRFRLLGMRDVALSDTNLVEVSPGAGWAILSGERHPPRKQTSEGRQVRHDLLQNQGVRFLDGNLPTSDQLDAALGAWTGYCFNQGKAYLRGRSPWLDEHVQAIREGYIVQPEGFNEMSASKESESFAPTG